MSCSRNLTLTIIITITVDWGFEFQTIYNTPNNCILRSHHSLTLLLWKLITGNLNLSCCLFLKMLAKNTRPLLFTCCSTLPTQILNGSSQEIPRGSISQILFDPALTNTHRFSCRWLDHMAASAAALFGLMWHTVCAHCAVSAQNHVAIFKVHAVWFIWSGQTALLINFNISALTSVQAQIIHSVSLFFVPYSFLFLASL